MTSTATRKAQLLGLSSSAALVFLVMGCGASNLQNYQSFSAAGVAFTDTVPAVVKESFGLSVRNDSQQLRDVQADLLDSTARSKELKESDELINTRLMILREFNQHAQLLKAYFLALVDLSQQQVSSGIGTSTGQLVSALGSVDARLKASLEQSTLLGKPIGDLIPAAATAVVQGIQSAALRNELQQHGQAVERSLALTEGFLTGLRDVAQSDFDSLQGTKRRDQIDLPYLSNERLPSDWDQKREALFVEQLSVPAIDKAAEASANLRRSFAALMEGTLSEASVATLVADVAEIVAIFEKKPT